MLERSKESLRENLASLGPMGYSSLGAVLVSVGINLLTESLAELFSEHYWTPFVWVGIMSGGFLVLAAFFCYQLVRNCERIREAAEIDSEGKPLFVRHATERDFVRKRFKAWKACMVIVLAFLSLMMWVGGFYLPGKGAGTPPSTQPTPTASP